MIRSKYFFVFLNIKRTFFYFLGENPHFSGLLWHKIAFKKRKIRKTANKC